MSFWSFLDFNLYRDMIEPSLKAGFDRDVRAAYLRNRAVLLEVQAHLARFGQLNLFTHVSSVISGVFGEYMTAKKFSYIRAGIYYFATYSFTTTFLLNDFASFVTSELAATLDQLEENYADSEE